MAVSEPSWSTAAAHVPVAEAWQLAAARAASEVASFGVLSYPFGVRAGPSSAFSTTLGAALPTPSPSSSSPQPLPPLQVLRSSQADALRLDAELGGMLQEQLGRLFEHFSPGRAAELEPELRAVLSLVVFGLSVWAGRAPPGAELLNLRYRNERAVASGPEDLVGASGVDGPGLSRPQRIVLGLGTAVLPYAWSRLCRAAHDDDWATSEYGSWRRHAWAVVRWCEAAVAAAALANSWAFLVRGDYRTLLERLVGARLVWRQASMTRLVSFEYLNRQLVWQQLSEALLLLLPLVDLARLRRAAMRALPRPQAVPGSAQVSAGAGGTVAGDEHGGASGESCPLCGSEDMLTAVRALPCRHVFCYYCLRGSTQADPRFTCPRDGVRVAAMRRVGLATGPLAAKA